MIKPNLEAIKPTLIKREFPAVVVVESTAFCNLKCIMCPQQNLKREKGEMSIETYTKVVDEIVAENNETEIWLAIMGEPFLIGDRLIDMIKIAKNKGVKKVHLNTNATFMNEEYSKKLIESGVNKVFISIDAFNEETYDKVRPNGNFKMTVENTVKLLKLKKELDKSIPEIYVQFIVMEENESEVEKFKEFWLEKGAIVKVRPKLGWGHGVKADNLKLGNDERNIPCPWMNREVHIHWDGTVVQCDADFEGEYSVGNVNEVSIKEVWNGELAKRRERHWNLDFDFEPCKDCKDWQVGKSYLYFPEK